MIRKSVFTERLNELRESKGITRNRLHKATGISSHTVYSWSQGKRSPNCNLVVILANYFSVSVDYLLGLTNNPEINH